MAKTSDEPPETATQIARGFRRGEAQALAVVRKRVRVLLAFRGYGIPRQDRIDVEQEVLAQLWKAVRKPGFDERAGFWGLVDVVTTRRCIDWVRAQRPTTELDDGFADAKENPVRSTLSRERQDLARYAISQLGEPCKQLLELHFKENLRYREIAEKLRKSEGALRMQMVRCIQRVRVLVEQLERPGDRRSLKVLR